MDSGDSLYKVARPFRFWYSNRIYQCMYFENKLYCLVKSYRASDSQKAFTLALKLAQQGKETWVMSLRTKRCVWASATSLIKSSRTTTLQSSRHEVLAKDIASQMP